MLVVCNGFAWGGMGMRSGATSARGWWITAAQNISTTLFLGLAALALGASILAAIGVLPWLSITAAYGALTLPWAGMAVQIFVTLLLVGLCCYLPVSARVLRLERSHRDFSMRMEDVAQAYRQSHLADRAEIFGLSSEFDSVRDRINHLRDHPDLAGLEPEIMELAAQMSHQSRDLATVYSAERVARAKAFLQQRQQELALFRDNLAMAKQACADLRRWSQEIRVEESVAAAQLDQIEADLAQLLPALGYEIQNPATVDHNVVAISAKPGE